MSPPMVAQWGRPGWTFLHCVSFAYETTTPTPDERRQMYVFLRATGDVLPCHRCRRHYAAYLDAHLWDGPASAALANRDALSRFVVDLHNDVNRPLGRPTLPYDVVRHAYEVDCGDDGWMVPAAMGAAAALAVLLLLLVRHRQASSRHA